MHMALQLVYRSLRERLRCGASFSAWLAGSEPYLRLTPDPRSNPQEINIDATG